MDSGSIATIAVVVIGFVGQTMYFRGAYGEAIKGIKESHKELKDEFSHHKESVRYVDTCKEMFDGIKDRVACLERGRR